jgi:hypothetical protein
VRVLSALVCLLLTGTALAATSATAMADAPCARYAATPERVLGGDDDVPDRILAAASAVSCPDDVWVQITACVQLQAVGGWVDVTCATSPRVAVTHFTRGARGVGLSFDTVCVSGVVRTHVVGGEGREPAEWDSDSVAVACNVHDTPVDTTPPHAEIVAGPSGLTQQTSPTFGFSSSEAGSTFQCRLDAPGWTTCSSPTTYSNLADGDYTFRVRATDLAGNVGSETSARFTLDTTAPVVEIQSGPAAATASTFATFVFASEPDVAALECRLDFSPWEACTSPTTYSNLHAGGHSVGVRATDAAGNLGPAAEWSWTIVGSPQEAEPAHGLITTPPLSDPVRATAAPELDRVVAPRRGSQPALRLPMRRGTVTATRRGVVKVSLGTCQRAVSGSLSLHAGLLLGRASFRTVAGQVVVVRVVLSRSGFAALRRRARVAVRATVALRDTAGAASSVTFSFTLKAARST